MHLNIIVTVQKKKEELDIILYLETPQTSLSMWNLSSMTNVGTIILPRLSLMRRSTLSDGLEFHTYLAKEWFIML